MRKCPYCAEQIPDDVGRCPFCASDLSVRPPAVAAVAVPRRAVGEGALEFSHSGRRYLLGYGEAFFGVWDREQPGGPVRAFPRIDDGWREAWLAYHALEPDSVPVGVGTARSPARSPTPADARATGLAAQWATREAPRRPVSGAWWLAPILFGWLGGLIAWAVVRDRDARMARALLVTGLAITAIAVLLVELLPPGTTGLR